jgi:glycosyltransferase involved in cell wall biosynthesis
MSSKNKLSHILFIVENNSVPPDIRVLREARTAIQGGYEVSVISPKNKNYPKNYEVVDGIEIYRHFAINNKSGKLNQVVEYANALFWETILCYRIFVKNPFNIIHAANPPDHIFILALFFKLFGVRYIFDHHDIAPELYVSKFRGGKNIIYSLLKLMERISCRTADLIISTNESYKNYVITMHGVNAGKVKIVRNDPELPETRRKQISQKGPNDFYKLIYVGSINIQDGVDILVRVAHILVKKMGQKKVHCTIIGDGEYLPQVKILCAELGMNAYFDFKGYIYDRREVAQFIEEADICLETAPENEVNRLSTFIKIMEYMVAGKPIVAFDLDETRATVEDTAILIPPGNIDLFAQAIQKLMENASAREIIGNKAQDRIFKKLNWSEAAKNLLDSYQTVLQF